VRPPGPNDIAEKGYFRQVIKFTLNKRVGLKSLIQQVAGPISGKVYLTRVVKVPVRTGYRRMCEVYPSVKTKNSAN
jgi:hypothetical protein